MPSAPPVLLCLLLVGPGCAGKEARPAPGPPVVDVTIGQPSAAGWQVGFVLPETVERVRFVRPYENRVERWRLVEAGLELRREGEVDVIRRTDGKKVSGFTLAIAPYVRRPEKNYQLFLPFSDGGMLLYTGYFDVALPGHRAVRSRFLLVPRPSETVIVAGEIHRAPARWETEGGETYVYFGSTAPVRTREVVAVVDRAFPPWLLRPIEGLIPRLFALYTERTGQRLGFQPMVYLSYGPPPQARGQVSVGGAVLPRGILQQDITLSLDRRSAVSAEVRELALFKVAHEVAHLWNGEQFTHEVPGGGWMHEGAADAFASRALCELGAVPAADYLERLSEAASLCGLALGGEPLKLARPGRNDYTCGLLIAALTEAAARRAEPGGDVFAFWKRLFAAAKGARYDDALYLRTLRALSGGEEVATTVSRLVNDPLPARAAFIEAALKAGGAHLREGEGQTSQEYRRLAARRALSAVLEGDCGPGAELLAEPGGLQVKPRQPCRVLGPQPVITGVVGFDVGKDGPAVYDHVRARCSAGASVELRVRHGGPGGDTRAVPCHATLPPRGRYMQIEAWSAIEEGCQQPR
jgi:hypothetical protein